MTRRPAASAYPYPHALAHYSPSRLVTQPHSPRAKYAMMAKVCEMARSQRIPRSVGPPFDDSEMAHE